MTDLSNDARLVEATALRDFGMTFQQMTRVAEGIGADLQRRAVKDVEVALQTLLHVDPMFVELDVVDPQVNVPRLFEVLSARAH